MRIEARWLVLLGVAAFVLIAVSYALGVKRGEDRLSLPVATAPSATAPARDAGTAAATSAVAASSAGRATLAQDLPPSHPPVASNATAAGRLPADSTLPAADAPVPSAGATGTARTNISFTHFRVGNRNIKTMLAEEGVMWVGTSGGVIRYDTNSDDYRVFDVRSGLLSNGVFHLSRLGEQLAVGTYGGGLSLFDERTERWKHYNIQHGLGDAFVYDVLELSNGDIWIATWSGANRVRGGALDQRDKWDLFTVENTSGGLPNDWVYGLAEGKNGEVWLATEGGLSRFAEGKWRSWGHAEGLGAPYESVRDQIEFTYDPAKMSSHHARQKVEQGLGKVDVAYNPNYIVSLLVNDDGSVWAGTWGGGLAHFDGERWSNLTMADGLPANHVFMLEHAIGGAIWVGTSKGLARYDGKVFEVFTTRDGLFADNVFSLASDQKGSLWVGSYGGVARIKGLAASM